MDTSIFLAQVLGLYFIIIGAVVLIRRQSLMPMVTKFIGNKMAQTAVASVELLAGLGIVVAYPSVTLDYLGLISLIGWMMLVEAVFYLVVPVKMAKKILGKCNTPMWYGAGSVIAIVMGLYLAGVGFGFIA